VTARAFSGRPADELTVDALSLTAADGAELGIDDVRIHPATLEHQARVAQAHGNPQLAENFRRAAELASLGEDDVLALYEALRPRRSTREELDTLASNLDDRGAARCAALVREASGVYARRGLLR
jgi:propanediol dehydratase small subunit